MAGWIFCFIYAVASSLFSDGLGISNSETVWLNNYFHIWYAAIAYPYHISVNYVMELVVRCLSEKDRNCFPTFVTTFTLYGGLNQIIFLFPGFGGGVISIGIAFCIYTLLLLVSSCLSVFLSGLIEFLNIFSFANNWDNLNSICFGNFLIMDERWLDSVLI